MEEQIKTGIDSLEISHTSTGKYSYSVKCYKRENETDEEFIKRLFTTEETIKQRYKQDE